LIHIKQGNDALRTAASISRMKDSSTVGTHHRLEQDIANTIQQGH